LTITYEGKLNERSSESSSDLLQRDRHDLQTRACYRRGRDAGGRGGALPQSERACAGRSDQSESGWAAHRLETQAVEEATNADLEWADAIILGTPTRYGLPSAQLKQFIDGTGGLWAKGKLVDKILSSFATVATQHGGHEMTITAINSVGYSWGCIIVAPSYADPVQFQTGNPYGSSFASNNGQLAPDETALAAAHFQGKRVADITRRFLAGKSVEA
jgi:NAD(P)H dehydrogenase (quinone)